ncbi:putative phospholipase D [Helianthus anomalus]
MPIIEARNLPNMDVVTGHIRRCVTFEACRKDNSSGGTVNTKLHSSGRKIITNDPYVKASVPQATVAHMRVLKNSKNPRWNERFIVPLAHELAKLEFQVKDDEVFGADVLGTVKIPAEKIAARDVISGWFTMENLRRTESELHIELKFIPCEKNPLYRHGIAGDPEHKGVRNTYFLVRKGSQVTLNQDAYRTWFSTRKRNRCWRWMLLVVVVVKGGDGGGDGGGEEWEDVLGEVG